MIANNYPDSRRPLRESQAHKNKAKGRVIMTASLLTSSLLPRLQSQGVKTDTHIYCSGQLPADKEGNLCTGTIGEKTSFCIKNLEAILTEAGSSLSKVVKTTVYLSEMDNFAVRFSFSFSSRPRCAHLAPRVCCGCTLPTPPHVRLSAALLITMAP